MMTNSFHRAQQLIGQIQQELEQFRKETYKTVHDDIGSTLSAVSIKSKLLGDKATDPAIKRQITEIHSLIKESMEYVTTLNRQLKQGWTPQTRETFFDDLLKELQQIGVKYKTNIQFEIHDHNFLSSLGFPMMMVIYEIALFYVRNAISRLSNNVRLNAELSATSVQLLIKDDGAIQPSPEMFQSVAEKVKSLGGRFECGPKDFVKINLPQEQKT